MVVRGRVQGVFFRDTVRAAAEREGVAGWVATTPTARSRRVFEGDAGAVERLLAVAREGPPGARVEDLEVRDEREQGIEGFRVR